MKLLLKILISVILIGWVLIFKMDWQECGDVLAKTNLWLLSLAFLLHVNGFLFSALRWQKLLKSQGVTVKLFPLVDSYLVSSFFNVFMPTRIGGDIIRVGDLKGAFNSLTKSASSVVVERFLGISILFLFAFIASLIRLPLVKEIPTIWIGLGLGVLGVTLFLSVIYFDLIGGVMRLLPRQKFLEKLVAEWQKFRESAVALLSHRDALAWGLGYSFLLQINVVVHFWIIGMAMNFDVPLLDYFFLIPIQLVILMLPTINGLGLREASNIVLFGYYGISATSAAAFSLIDLTMMILVGLVGWMRFLSRRSISLALNPVQKGVN